MQIELTKSQIRKIVINELMDKLENKDSELNFAIKYTLQKVYRLGHTETSQWELKKRINHE
jgi:3'-phosphoadenosine 5'-phosphosulfate sulfotransferase